MTKSFGVIGGDQRSACLARKLAEGGFSVMTWGLSAFGAPNNSPLEHTATADTVILPIPLSRGGMLNCAERSLPLEELFSLLAPCQQIFAGGVREDDRLAAQRHSLTLTDLMAQEDFTVRNVIPTAEGAIELAMEALPTTLHGTPCLILGFGRIGKLLSHRLKALGAEVTVSARKREDLAWIDAFGYGGIHSARLAGTLGSFRVIFNTVPHLLLTRELLSELRRDCVLIELASADGIDRAAAEEAGLRLVNGRGLPGRTAPERVADIICSAIMDHRKGEWA